MNSKYLLFFLAVCPFFASAQNCTFNDGGEAFTNGAAAFTDGQTCEKPFSIYPNPTTDLVYFSQNTEGAVYSAAGQFLQKFNGIYVDVSHLGSGLYFIRLKDRILKIIKI